MGVAWGIDVGASGLKIVKLGISKSHSEVMDAAFFPTEGDFGPEWGPRLKAFLASRKLKPSKVVVSTAGKDVVLDVNGFPRAPADRLAKMVALYVEQFGERHEEPLVHDWGVLQIPTGVRDELTTMIAMAKDPQLERIKAGLVAAGVSVSGFVPSPVAVYNTYVKCAGAAEGVTYLIDIGEKSLSLALLKDSVLLFARNITGGLDMFVEPLMGALEVKRSRAVRFLLEEGRVGAGEETETLEYKAGRSLASSAGQLIQLLGSSVKFCQVKTRISGLDPQHYVLSGGGSRIPNLAGFMGSETGKSAGLMDIAELDTGKLSEEAAADYADGMTYVAAIGAAQIAGDNAVFPIQIRSASMVDSEAFYSRTLVMMLSLAMTVILLGFAGWTAHSRLGAEQERHKQIKDLHQQYRDRQQAKKDLDARRELLQKKIELVEGRVEPGARAFQVVALIQDVKPEAVWLKRIRLIKIKDGQGDDAPETPAIQVDGVVEESKLTVKTVERLFETALATHPVVEKVDFTDQRDIVEAGRTEFSMTIRYRNPSTPR